MGPLGIHMQKNAHYPQVIHTGVHLHILGLGIGFLAISPKAQVIKERIN
jgi:hypothetical protein